MRSKDASCLPQSVAEDSMRFIPLIGYSYPFEQSADAAWLANELKASVLATHGRLAVIDAELLVVLPETVSPKHIGNLALFKFEQEQGVPKRVEKPTKPSHRAYHGLLVCQHVRCWLAQVPLQLSQRSRQ